MNALKRWLLLRGVRHFLKGAQVTGFLSKFFSSDSIISRLVRGLLLGLVAGAANGTVHLPTWAISLIALVAGMIPAGQNNAHPAISEPPTPVSKTA